MLKALLRKQFLQLNAGYYMNRKNGKRRSKTGTILYVALFAFLFLCLGAAFYAVADTLSKAMIPLKLAWLYFAVMSVIAVALGTFGSVFNTYAALYHAKDNELLLSMPVPPRMILASRLIGVFGMGLMYESIVLIPAIIAWFVNGNPSALSAINCVLLILVIGVFVLVLTCILGWVVALISAKLKNKSFITVILSIAFIGAYYWCSANFNNLLQRIAANGAKIGATVKGSAYPLYLLGRAAEGHAPSMLIFTAIIAALFIITWFVLEKTFLRITTMNDSGTKAVYREKPVKMRGLDAALFRREWKRYASSATYILNSSLASLFMVVGAVAALIFAGKIRAYIELIPIFGDFVYVALTAAICLIAAMNFITAPSISLEGKNIWIVQSMPVPAAKIFDAKQYLHWTLTIPPAVLLCVSMAVALKIDFTIAALMTTVVILFVMFCSAGGLMLNLLRPNLAWTNEVMPIKQSMSTSVALFGGWLLAIALGGAGWFALKHMELQSFLIICIVVFALAARFINRWLKGKGAEIFSEL